MHAEFETAARPAGRAAVHVAAVTGQPGSRGRRVTHHRAGPSERDSVPERTEKESVS